MEAEQPLRCKHAGKRLFICISEDCHEDDNLACQSCMYSPPHYHSRVKLRNLTEQEHEVFSFIPLVQAKKAIEQIIVQQQCEEKAKLLRELQLKQLARMAKLQQILSKEVQQIVADSRTRRLVYKGGFDSKLRPASEVAAKLEKYKAELLNRQKPQQPTARNGCPMVIEEEQAPQQQSPPIQQRINGGTIAATATPQTNGELIKIESPVATPPPSSQPHRVVRLPNNVIRTKPRVPSAEVNEGTPVPPVIMLDEEECEPKPGIIERFWGTETPTPDAPPSSVPLNPEEVFGKLLDQKSTSFKAAADYLLVNTHHTELQMTVSPFSFETPEYAIIQRREFKKLVLALMRLKDLQVYSLTIKPNWIMTTDSACLLDKELQALPRLNTVRLQFRPSRSDIGHYKFPLLANKLGGRFLLLNNQTL